jgi:hypothetical protein
VVDPVLRTAFQSSIPLNTYTASEARSPRINSVTYNVVCSCRQVPVLRGETLPTYRALDTVTTLFPLIRGKQIPPSACDNVIIQS